MKLIVSGPAVSKAAANRGLLLVGVAAASLMLPTAAYAQKEEEAKPAPAKVNDAAEADGNEIVVTATKREQTLQDVPVAVSVTTAATIERAQIRDVMDLQSVVPSLRVTQSNGQFATTYNVRGFGTSGNNIGLEPSVAMFVDGVYRSRAVAQISDESDKRLFLVEHPDFFDRLSGGELTGADAGRRSVHLDRYRAGDCAVPRLVADIGARPCEVPHAHQ